MEIILEKTIIIDAILIGFFWLILELRLVTTPWFGAFLEGLVFGFLLGFPVLAIWYVMIL